MKCYDVNQFNNLDLSNCFVTQAIETLTRINKGTPTPKPPGIPKK